MAIADLAILTNKKNKPVGLALISERQRISLSYLEQLFAKLKRAGIVKSVKGPGGGYLLGKPSSEIKLSEIKNAIDEKEEVSVCPEGSKCKKGTECNSHLLWKELSLRLDSFLNSVTLESLINKDFIEVKID